MSATALLSSKPEAVGRLVPELDVSTGGVTSWGGMSPHSESQSDYQHLLVNVSLLVHCIGERLDDRPKLGHHRDLDEGRKMIISGTGTRGRVHLPEIP
jgi:hypothetical protein